MQQLTRIILAEASPAFLIDAAKFFEFLSLRTPLF
jgi:hypothetical protein